MLLCTYFQVCYDELSDKTSPIKRVRNLKNLKKILNILF